MEQKNTIIKCKAHPNCLFNYNGICDNYVINIGADGKCESYVETEWLEQNKEYYDSCYYCQHALHEKNNKWLYCEIDGEKIDRPLRNDQCKQFQSVYSRGQRAKCNIYDDACDASFLKKDLEKIQQTLEQDSIPCTIKVAELNKSNKNQSIINDWDYAATPDICKTCKKVVYGQPCKWKDVAYGVWTCYERDESIKRAGTLNECWWCDFFNSEKRSCKHKDPDINRYGCHSSQSTGGNR